MKTIITFLRQYRWNLLLILACSQIFILLLAIDDKPEFANGIIIAMNSMLIVYTATVFVPYVMQELRSLNYSQLPATTLRKYITALALIFVFMILCLAFSVGIECIITCFVPGCDELVCTQITYLLDHTGHFSSTLLVMGINALFGSLFRNKWIMMSISCVCSVGGILTMLIIDSIPPVACCLFAGLAIALFIASYQIYKRWQPSNTGILMI